MLYQSVILSVINYGLGLTTQSQSNLLKLDRVQNEAMRVILGTTKDTSIEAVRYLLDLPSMETRHKVEQVKANLNVMQNPKNPLHDALLAMASSPGPYGLLIKASVSRPPWLTVEGFRLEVNVAYS